MKPLSPVMREHLIELLDMPPGKRRGAYPGLKINTLRALQERGLVNSWSEAGAMFCPPVGIRWSLTKAGREAAMKAKEKRDASRA